MTNKRKAYTSYSKEFKLEAIRLMEESDRPASEIAIQLGIRRNQLYKWKEQMIQKGDVPTATSQGQLMFLAFNQRIKLDDTPRATISNH